MSDSPPGDVTLDPVRQARAREYARVSRRLLAVDLALSAALVIGFLVTGASAWLRDALLSDALLGARAGVDAPGVLVAAYVTVVLVAYSVVILPLDWYTGYTLPHRYDLSTQTPRAWWSDQLKSLALALALGVPVAEVIYLLLRVQPDTWWVWAGGFLIAVSVVLGQLAPVLIVPLFFKLTPLENAELVERVTQLGERAGVRVVGVYTIDLSRRTKAANAMVMGLGRTKRIALGDTLYAEYTPDEIETILAHELGHQVHRDLELGILVDSAVMLFGLYLAKLFLDWGVARFGFDGPGDMAALPLLALAAGVFSLVTMPPLNAYSRWRERLADRYAVEITGKPRAFADMLTRVANQNLAEADPPRWVVWLLYSHPPVRERLRAAQGT